MAPHGEVLVALLNKQLDLTILQTHGWYRIPLVSAKKWLRHRWPPQWMAFYQTAVFGPDKYTITYYAQVRRICTAYRWQLFPQEPRDHRSERQYYQVFVDALQPLPRPIVSHRRRRLIFIPTTWTKFINATEINDLYDDSPLEDRLWGELKLWHIPAERQEFVTIRRQEFAPDFTIRCAKGQIAVETDGDRWHANPTKAAEDNVRENVLKAAGWQVVRFSPAQLHECGVEYCVQTIVEVINRLGGLDEGGMVVRRFDVNAPRGVYQPSLFETT